MRSLPLSSCRALVLLTLTTLVAGCQSDPDPKPTPDDRTGLRVFTGPTFLLEDGAEAAAVVVDDANVIVSVHEKLEEAPAGGRVSLPDGVAVAGLHDAHLHVQGIGQVAERADLRGATSVDEIVRRLQAFRAAHLEAAFVDGRGWDQSLFHGGAFPNRDDLAALGDVPVVLTRVDGHALWVNDAALALAGIDAETPDPDGGAVHRGADGAPTGILIDNAMGLLRSKLPAPTPDDRKRWLRTGLSACAGAGLVGVHDMGMSVATFRALQALDDEGAIPIRVYVYLDGSDDEALGIVRNRPTATARVEVRGLKLFADGAMGSRGAALLDDYSDAPGERGLLLTSADVLKQRVADVHAAGAQVAIHAIGDRGVRTALDAIAFVQRDDVTRRHRVEHAQMIATDDIARFKTLGVIASMQPTHATSDMRWVEARVGSERVNGTYAWRTLLETGVPLAFGSDAPVESHRPSWGVYAALTRQDHAGSPEGGWRPEQRVTLGEALAAFSSGAAFAVGAEDKLGRLAPGQVFDVTLWPRGVTEAPERWLTAWPRAIVVGGELRVLARP